MAPGARADGDPASDVLISQQLFLPSDAGLSPTLAARLTTDVQRVNSGGYTIRVAVIASPFDLGSVTALWRKPRQYARFLGEELVGLYEGRLLIAMPNGLGFFDADSSASDEATLVERLPVPKDPDGVGRAVIDALGRLSPDSQRTDGASAKSGGSAIVVVGAAAGAGVLLAGLAAIVLLRRRCARG